MRKTFETFVKISIFLYFLIAVITRELRGGLNVHVVGVLASADRPTETVALEGRLPHKPVACHALIIATIIAITPLSK